MGEETSARLAATKIYDTSCILRTVQGPYTTRQHYNLRQYSIQTSISNQFSFMAPMYEYPSEHMQHRYILYLVKQRVNIVSSLFQGDCEDSKYVSSFTSITSKQQGEGFQQPILGDSHSRAAERVAQDAEHLGEFYQHTLFGGSSSCISGREDSWWLLRCSRNVL